jgi:hypothetical protein
MIRTPLYARNQSLELFINGYLNQNPSSLTNTELQCLYRHFRHPVTERLYQVLERAECDDVNKKPIEYITKYCLHCQNTRNHQDISSLLCKPTTTSFSITLSI